MLRGVESLQEHQYQMVSSENMQEMLFIQAEHIVFIYLGIYMHVCVCVYATAINTKMRV